MPKVHNIHLYIRLRKSNKKAKHRHSFYSIEFGPPVDTIRGRPDNMLDYEGGLTDNAGQMSPKPMTPRRVKRRSVMTRGTNGRQSTTSRRSHTSNRSSVRNSRRKFQQNPVTKLIDQQNAKPFASFSHNENPTLTATNLKTLNNDIITSNTSSKTNYNSFARNINPDPIYYNTSASTTQLQQSWNSSGSMQQQQHQQPIQGGHYNPTYQHSTPNLANSNEHVDELYNNRPPSVRSSYSNFHGTRPLSSYNPTKENVFAGITGGPQPQQQQHNFSQPQVPPTRRSASRESIRSMAFLNNGPPAYNLNYHTPPDSETTM